MGLEQIEPALGEDDGDLSMAVKERIQQLGFAVLAALMIVVLYNDVISNVTRLKTG